MAKTERELTVPERRSIRKLVTGSCANYDRDYGCLPLDCECPMLGMWCDENGLSPLKARSFSDALVAHAGKYNLEHCNNVTNPAGRRVWGFMGIEAVARPDINSFCGNSLRTYVLQCPPRRFLQRYACRRLHRCGARRAG